MGENNVPIQQQGKEMPTIVCDDKKAMETENVKPQEKKDEVKQIQNAAPIQQQEKEIPKIVSDEKKAMETENVKAEEKKDGMEEEKLKAVVEEKKIDDSDGKKEENSAAPGGVEKSSSFREESNLLSDLKENEKKALSDFRSKIEEAILQNKFFEEKSVKEKERESSAKEEQAEKSVKEGVKQDDSKKQKKSDEEVQKEVISALKEGIKEEETQAKPNSEELKNGKGEAARENIRQEAQVEIKVDKDIAVWGIPLLPSKGDTRTDAVLLKMLRAREFKVNDAFEMLRNILRWRKENRIDSILGEEIDMDLSSLVYMEGNDRIGHPVCYNSFAVLGNEEMTGKAFEEKRDKFIRGRIQLMEKGIQKLDFNPGGVSALLQVIDLKNTPLPTRKELRVAIKKAVELLQDNYPEYAAKYIFLNVPFWYYAYSAIFAPSLSQRTKNKFVYARTTRVTDTLLKYISPSQIPVQYGGLKRENDSEFTIEDEAIEVFIKAGAQETIEIPAPEVGKTLIWDLTVSGWEVNYKEEFVPSDEGSYTIIVQKEKRIGLQDGTIRNSFTNRETGKIVLTIENGAFKKKRVLYRYKNKISASS